jgi:hypothetical protein
MARLTVFSDFDRYFSAVLFARLAAGAPSTAPALFAGQR